MANRALVAWSWVVVALLAAHDLTHLLDDGLDTGLGLLAAVAIPQWLFVAVAMASLVSACLFVGLYALALRLGDGTATWRRPASSSRKSTARSWCRRCTRAVPRRGPTSPPAIASCAWTIRSSVGSGEIPGCPMGVDWRCSCLATTCERARP